MSKILDRIKAAAGENPVRPFILIMGASGSGKTTLAGTLPGRTLLLSVKGKEYGTETAQAMAATREGSLASYAVGTIPELIEIAKELTTDTEFDNVFVDGFSALTYLAADDPETRALLEAKKGGNPFIGFNRIWSELTAVQKAFSDLTYATCASPKRVFFTVATEMGADAVGNPEIKVAMKGKASLGEFTRPAPTVVAMASRITGDLRERVLVTGSVGVYDMCRVNGVLDQNNPGMIEPDLGSLLNLIK